jgi:hypothetical protein
MAISCDFREKFMQREQQKKCDIKRKFLNLTENVAQHSQYWQKKEENIVCVHFNTLRLPVLEYCAQAFHHSIPKYLADELETVHKKCAKNFISCNDIL